MNFWNPKLQLIVNQSIAGLRLVSCKYFGDFSWFMMVRGENSKVSWTEIMKILESSKKLSSIINQLDSNVCHGNSPGIFSGHSGHV